MITVNGKQESLPEPVSIREYLVGKGIEPGQVLVLYNDRVIGREQWGEIRLQQGDTLEVFKIVGGG